MLIPTLLEREGQLREEAQREGLPPRYHAPPWASLTLDRMSRGAEMANIETSSQKHKIVAQTRIPSCLWHRYHSKRCAQNLSLSLGWGWGELLSLILFTHPGSVDSIRWG